MREILFRGKRISDGEWSTGYFARNDDLAQDNVFIINMVFVPIGYGLFSDAGHCIDEVDPETVGQYTGLTDKNGTKIFEGDIVRHYNFSIFPEYFSLGVIFFDEDACMFRRTVVKQVGGEEYTENANGIAKISKKCEYEVVGNIHDNPELLTEVDRNG